MERPPERPPTHLAAAEVIDLLADVGDVGLGLVVRGAPSDVVVGLGQTDDGALQPDEDGVGERGVVQLRVVAGDLVHPALEEGNTSSQPWCASATLLSFS